MKKVLYIVLEVIGVIGTAGAFLLKLDMEHEKDEDTDEKKK